MRALTSIFILFSSLLLVLPSTASALLDYEDDHVQLELEPGVLIDDINAVYGTTSTDEAPPLHLVQIPEGESVWVLVGELENDPRVTWAEPSYVNATPEALRSQVVGLVGGTIEDYEDQEVYGRLRLDALHEHTTGAGVIVAILDTGVNGNHPALLGHVLAGYDFVDDDDDPSDTANGIDDDLDDLVDEGAGHGTMVAGIAHLVAPDSEILPVRVIDDEGTGRTFDVVKGIQYAIEHGAQVVNLSLGLRTPCQALSRGVDLAVDAGIIVVAAGGNDPIEDPPFFPAFLPEVHGVAALDSVDVKAEFSSFHPSISVSGPGVGIRAPFLDDGWALGAGSSFAAPFVSGQAAIIVGATPSLPKTEADAIVRSGVVDVYQIPENGPFYGKLGSGRIDGLETWNAMQNPVTGVEPSLEGPTVGSVIWTAAPNPSSLSSEVRISLLLANRSATPLSENFPLTGRTWTLVDVSGRAVRSLTPGIGEDGLWSAVWDGRDDAGRAAPAGLYFVHPGGRTAGTRLLRVHR